MGKKRLKNIIRDLELDGYICTTPKGTPWDIWAYNPEKCRTCFINLKIDRSAKNRFYEYWDTKKADMGTIAIYTVCFESAPRET